MPIYDYQISNCTVYKLIKIPVQLLLIFSFTNKIPIQHVEMNAGSFG